MKIKYSELEYAYFFVSMSLDYSNQAILCKDTGEIYYASENGEEDEIPEEVYEKEECVEIPSQHDLDLGKNLVFEFVEEYIPEMYNRFHQIFRKRGAYTKYKDFLADKGLLKIWYDFENERRTQALKEWCIENEIELDF